MDFKKEILKLQHNVKESNEKLDKLKVHINAIESKNEQLVYHIYHVSRATFLRLKGLYNIEMLGKTEFKYTDYWMKTFDDGDKDYSLFQEKYLFNGEKDNG